MGVKQKLFEKLAEGMQPNFEYQHKAPWWQRFNPFSPKEPPEQVTLSGEDVRIIGDYQFLLGLGEVDRNAADCIRNAQDMKERLDLLKRARAANPTLVDT